MNENILTIIKRPEVLKLTGWSKSTLYLRIKAGLFPKPISLGARAVGYVDQEVHTIVKAMIANKTGNEIRAIVSKLTNDRSSLI